MSKVQNLMKVLLLNLLITSQIFCDFYYNKKDRLKFVTLDNNWSDFEFNDSMFEVRADQFSVFNDEIEENPGLLVKKNFHLFMTFDTPGFIVYRVSESEENKIEADDYVFFCTRDKKPLDLGSFRVEDKYNQNTILKYLKGIPGEFFFENGAENQESTLGMEILINSKDKNFNAQMFDNFPFKIPFAKYQFSLEGQKLEQIYFNSSMQSSENQDFVNKMMSSFKSVDGQDKNEIIKKLLEEIRIVLDLTPGWTKIQDKEVFKEKVNNTIAAKFDTFANELGPIFEGDESEDPDFFNNNILVALSDPPSNLMFTDISESTNFDIKMNLYLTSDNRANQAIYLKFRLISRLAELYLKTYRSDTRLPIDPWKFVKKADFDPTEGDDVEQEFAVEIMGALRYWLNTTSCYAWMQAYYWINATEGGANVMSSYLDKTLPQENIDLFLDDNILTREKIQHLQAVFRNLEYRAFDEQELDIFAELRRTNLRLLLV